MKQIREGVFETNSSSTHSISIYKWKAPPENDIPRDSTVTVDGSIRRSEISDECGKLNYIAVMLASLLDHERDYNADTPSKESVFSRGRFAWLKELIERERNTTIIFKSDESYFPYLQTAHDEYRGMTEIFDCDVNDETVMKARMKEIIFEKDIVIEDRENEY